MAYEPMKVWHVSGVNAFPAMERHAEGQTKTFKVGVPLVLSSGNVQEAAFGGAEIVFGVSAEAAHNLATAGTAEELSVETPPNQTSAKVIPVGAPIKDGKCGYYKADGRTMFSIMLLVGQVFTQAMTSTAAFGIAKDATSGFWYVDNTDTSGDNAVFKVVGVDPNSPNSTSEARVFGYFIPSLRYWA